MAPPFAIEAAREEDISDIISILVPAFAPYPIEALLGNIDTPDGRRAAGERHLRAWREHADELLWPSAIKCVHTDPQTNQRTIVGFAYWLIYDRVRTAEQYTRPHYLLSASWVPNSQGQQDLAKRTLQPILDKRVEWLGGRRCAVLMYMCVDPVWRRRGVSTMCVKWGLAQCEHLNIPAYLEASDEGAPVYEKLGFEAMEEVSMELDGERSTFPIMMWFPSGTSVEDKKPALRAK
ncbi:hypothetical protein BAUCODRAFT_314323 [Baudoinia panamericana UAMH 10762]|uniref:N-acetyltransferase domain-containing protein n=1 Tax=Baudoinia panamericana (strain UAMH 10762) TaxID=717646 RepID=M2MXV2_BAUPA|nr:uncharacterized protein BAUCODRAFT_314323 [Baudoinia panamericana UAMH 10762]EMC91085.1 hypothetical protein BAUCODRAFT_314323 [Baudoinia panamericana UAMH 10762]